MGLAFVPLYINYLGIEAYGLIGFFAVLHALLGLLDMGMTPTLSREMGRYTGGGHTNVSIRDLLRSIEIIAVVLSLMISTFVVVGADWVASSWVNSEELPEVVVRQSFMIMGIVTALRFLEGVYRSSIIGLQRQVWLNLVNCSMATLRGIGAICILKWISPSIQAFFIWQGIVSLFTLIVLALLTYGVLPAAVRTGRFSIKALKGIYCFAGGILLITALKLLLTKTDKFLLSKLLTLNDYGQYMLATVVAASLTYFVGPITQALSPKLNELYASKQIKALDQAFHQGTQLVTVIVGSIAIVMIMFAEICLKIWTQDDTLSASVAPLLSLLTVGYLINFLLWVPYQMQLVYGWTSLSVRINSIAVILLVPINILITPKYGSIGAAWVWVILNIGYAIFGIHFMFKKILLEHKKRWYIEDTFVPLIAALLMTLLFKYLSGLMDSLYYKFTIVILAFICSFVAALFSASSLRNIILNNKHVMTLIGSVHKSL
jgi:O-antigen/teichoic acid export membrane protein